MSLDSPPLLLLALPSIAVALWLRRRVFLRSLFACAAVLAAAAPRVGEPGAPARCRVYVLDASASVGGAGEALALAKADARDLGPADEAAVVWVAERASVEFAAGPAARLAALQRPAAPIAAGASRLADGLDLAASLVPAGRSGEIVLISDGRDTGGGSAVAAASVRRRGVAVRALPCGAGRRADARVDRVEAPGRVRAGERFEAVAVVSADFPTRVRITCGGDSREVGVEPGVPARVVFPQEPATKAITWLAARVEALDFRDVAPQNDANEAPVLLDGPLPVLVLAPEPGRAAERALAADRRFSVETAARPADLALFAAVVLDGLAAGDLGDPALERLAAFARSGGGLLLLGGPAGFGSGGFGDTPLDDASPFQAAPEENFTLVVLLDASGSMNEEASPGRTKLAEAREALRSLAGAARPGTTFAFAAFAGQARWIHPPTTDRAALLRALEKLDAGGPTLIAPALELARGAIGGGKSHVVLVSDGQSAEPEADLTALAAALRGAGATVSAIAEGADANAALLEKLAGAPPYLMRNFSELARLLREDLAREQGLTAKGTFASEGLPAVLQLNVVKPKEDAEPLLSAGGRPLAALRPFGRGRVAAFASALDPVWVADPARWGAEIAVLAARIARPDPGGRLSLAVDGADLVADWLPADPGDTPAAAAELTLPDGSTRPLTLIRSGAARFSARLREPSTGRFALATGPTRAAASRPWPPEFAASGARPDLLAALEGPASGPAPQPTPPRELAPWLLVLAAALVLLEFALEARASRAPAQRTEEKPISLA
ncbi:MAG: VWA domain-containing protein [Planctomycetia bacterium]|nr:VWA domain-containing protein [Planctomycetia bacterium]